jgi:hypothetical protein
MKQPAEPGVLCTAGQFILQQTNEKDTLNMPPEFEPAVKAIRIATCEAVSKRIRRCQRNWDHSKTVPDKDVKILAEVAKHAPSKQDEGYYDIAIIQSREIIEQIYPHTDGFTVHNPETGKWDITLLNAQANANVLFIWHPKEPNAKSNRNFWNKTTGLIRDEHEAERLGQAKPNNSFSRVVENAYCAMGCSITATAWAAAEMGYVTGINKNLSMDEISEITGMPFPRFSLGIGFPKLSEDKWYISNEGDEYTQHSLKEKEVTIKYF